MPSIKYRHEIKSNRLLQNYILNPFCADYNIQLLHLYNNFTESRQQTSLKTVEIFHLFKKKLIARLSRIRVYTDVSTFCKCP